MAGFFPYAFGVAFPFFLYVSMAIKVSGSVFSYGVFTTFVSNTRLSNLLVAANSLPIHIFF